MKSPSAAVRITLDAVHLDENGGLLNDLAIRWIRGLVVDVPARARLTVDLGTLRRVDDLMIQEFAAAPCAGNIVFEAADWRVSQAAALKLTEELADQGVA